MAIKYNNKAHSKFLKARAEYLAENGWFPEKQTVPGEPVWWSHPQLVLRYRDDVAAEKQESIDNDSEKEISNNNFLEQLRKQTSFKVGDKVKIIEDAGQDYGLFLGQSGEIGLVSRKKRGKRYYRVIFPIRNGTAVDVCDSDLILER